MIRFMTHLPPNHLNETLELPADCIDIEILSTSLLLYEVDYEVCPYLHTFPISQNHNGSFYYLVLLHLCRL